MMTYGAKWRPWGASTGGGRSAARKHAVERGINFFDTADMYSAGECKVLTSRFVREFCHRGDRRRDQALLSGGHGFRQRQSAPA